MQRESIQILLIESEEGFARKIAEIIGEIHDYHPISLLTVPSLSDGLPYLDDESVDIVLISLNPSKRPGLKPLSVAHARNPNIPLIVIAPEGSEDTAHSALQEGAYDFLSRDEVGARFFAHVIHHARESKRTNERLKRASGQWRTTFDAIPDWVLILDEECRIVKTNKSFANVFGMHPKQVIGRLCRELLSDDDWPCADCPRARVIDRKTPQTKEVYNRRLSIHQEITASPLLNPRGEVIGTAHIIKDITEKKHVEAEREQLIADLTEALAKVKTLSGLLPICASCKRIRDDKGKWSPIEVYIRDRSEAQFSHGICPDCAKRLYPKFRGKQE